jgi:hypothetical protein
MTGSFLCSFLELERESMQGFIEDVRSGYGRFPEAKFHTYLNALGTTHMLYMCIQQAKLKNTLDMEEVSSMHGLATILTLSLSLRCAG